MNSEPFEWMVALRFLRKGRFQTLLIVLGIASGVAVQFFLLSLIGGLQAGLIEKTVGSAPHIVILPAEFRPRTLKNSFPYDDFRRYSGEQMTEIISWKRYLAALSRLPEVTAATAAVNGAGTLEKGGLKETVLIKGLSIREGGQIYKFSRNWEAGKLDLSGDRAIMSGSVADKMGLGVGDQFFLRNNAGDGSYFTVSGLVDLGNSAVGNLIFLNLDRARSLFGLTGISAIEAQMADVFGARDLAVRLRSNWTGVKIESWQEKNRELLSALASQSSSSGIIQFFIVFSITLGIASVLAIAAVQKSRQLGILKAMGITNRSVALIFIWQGLIMGGAGSVLGIALGLGLAKVFMETAGRSGVSFGLQINAANLALPVLLAVFAATLAATIPAQKAWRLKPMEVIRNA